MGVTANAKLGTPALFRQLGSRCRREVSARVGSAYPLGGIHNSRSRMEGDSVVRAVRRREELQPAIKGISHKNTLWLTSSVIEC